MQWTAAKKRAERMRYRWCPLPLRAHHAIGDRRPVSGVQASLGFSLAMRRGAAELGGPKAVDHRVRAYRIVLGVGYLQGSGTACRRPGGYWKAQRESRVPGAGSP